MNILLRSNKIDFMIKNIFNITFFGLILIVLILGVVFIYQKNTYLNADLLEAKVLNDFYQYDKFPDGKELILDYFSQHSSDENKIILGGIVSHHLPLAFPLIANFYQNFQGVNPEVVFVLGPDHFHKSSFPVATTELPFSTPFGFLEVDKNIVENLKKENIVKIDNQVFKEEHSILSQSFFIKYLFPKAKIVPLILQPDLDIKDAKIIADGLEPYKEKAIFIASVDFSHYFSLRKAQILDENTKNKLENFYFENLNIKECDSPVSLQVLFLLAQNGGYDIKILETKNSADFSQLKDNVTGYISAIFEK